ncbi:peptidase S8/S53 domain-containing protein, partial [Daedaleopsis nitida]
LDIEYTVGIATGVPITFMSVGYSYHDHLLGFLDLMNYYLDQDAPPNVVTTSYGADEHLISRDLTVALCNAHAQLGARGVTIIFSSGNGGVAEHTNATCADGNFVPAYPSIYPYVTSVGATRGIPETGAYFSAGGFSNYFATPDYQADAVKSYIARLGDTYSGKYNTSGRGYPDVSAQGYKHEVVIKQEVQTLSGTSARAPFWAAVLSLLNNRLIAAGKSPLEFLNPFLYSTGASALNDITSGSNPGCDTDGFFAKAGWDPVTGLGTNSSRLSACNPQCIWTPTHTDRPQRGCVIRERNDPVMYIFPRSILDPCNGRV